MIPCLWIMVVGLVFTLAGVIIAFVLNPPVLDEVDAEKFWWYFNNRPETPEAIKAAAVKAERSEKLKFRVSFIGIGLIIAGTALQLIGTVWQVIRLACGG